MLRSFRVANHKSFRDEAELLLTPAYDKSRPAVPVAAVFGANASGKSNLLDALRWLQSAVRESYAAWEPGAGIPRSPFRLDPEAPARPSLYCVEIVIGESRYTYGLEVDDERVLAEWLYTYPHNRRRVIFERERDTTRLGSTVPDYRLRGDQLAQQTRDNALFLSVAAHNDLSEVQPTFAWFRSGVRFVDGGDVAQEELRRRLLDSRRRPATVALIRAADLGISDVTAGDDAEHIALEAELVRSINEATALAEKASRYAHDVTSAAESSAEEGVARLDMLRDEIDRNQALGARVRSRVAELIDQRVRLGPPGQLRFHHGKDGARLGLEDQSAGTRSWVGLVASALGALDRGELMVVDEVDASLHPHLTARLINLFRTVDTNPNRAQLLLTTHDATLLDEETLSRDEIWFVEKEVDSGATRLYPLTDFHPRKNENTQGRYLAGAYGAIPVLSEYRFRRSLRTGDARDAAA